MADKTEASEAPKGKVGTTQASFMFLHGEKIGLGFSVAVLLGYGIFTTMLTSDEEVLTQAEEAMGKAREPSDIHKKAVQAKKDEYKSYNPKTDWEKLEKTKPLNPWAASYVTKHTVTEIEPREQPTEVVWECPTVSIDTIDSVLGAVNLKFKTTPPKVLGKVGDKKMINEAKVIGFKIERRMTDEKAPAADKQWKDVTDVVKIDEKAMTVADPKITPKTKYEYRMVPKTDARARDTEKEIHRVKPPEYSEAAAVHTVGYFKIKMKSIMAGGGDAPAQISFTVEKYDSAIGKSFTITPRQVEGDVIGSQVVPGTEDDPKYTFEWTVPDPDNRTKKHKVDFNTGWKIMKAEMSVAREIPYRVCRTKRDASGTLTCEGVEIKKRNYTGNHVSIKDDDGQIRDEWSPEPPKVEDKLCEEHSKLKGTPITEP